VDGTQIVALLSGIILALAVRLSNMITAWLAKVLGVNPPAPIPEPGDDDDDDDTPVKEARSG